MKKKFNISSFFQKIIIYFGIFFSAMLVLVTLLFTTQIYADELKIDFSPIIPLVGLALFIAILLLKPVQKFLEKLDSNKLAWFVFWWALIMSILWIFIANVLPMWDSADLSYAAKYLDGERSQFVNGKWGSGSYVEHFPFQLPIITIIFVCIKIAGSNFVILYELLNCFACAFSLFLTVKLTTLFFNKKSASTLSAILSILFIPLILYCTFIYGNIICLPFALLCWYTQKRAIDLLEKTISKKNKKKVICLIVISIVCGGISVILKGSMMVAVLASAVIWVLWGLKQKNIKQKIFFVIIAILVALCSKILTAPVYTILSQKTKVNLNNGVPSITWVAMGVGGGLEYKADLATDDSIRESLSNPGYYDGFVWALEGKDYSVSTYKDLSWKYIGTRMEHYLKEPLLAIKFFGKKLLLEWTEPTFEGFLASNWDTTAPDGYNMAKRDYTYFAKSFYYGGLNSTLFIIMDVMQTVLAAGTLLCLWLSRKNLNIKQLAPLVCVLGGFVLYIFWENKTQYMLPFYLFMIPLAGYGWSLLIKKVTRKIHQ